jgi:hypothetical protein
VNTEEMLLKLYKKPMLTLDEVCECVGMHRRTAYNRRSAHTFPVPMSGKPLRANLRDVAIYLDNRRAANK